MPRISILICLLLQSLNAQSAGFWDDHLINGSARTEYPVGKGTGTDYLNLNYRDNMLTGAEGCQFDAIDSFSGCPGRAGLDNLPNGKPVWAGTLQRAEACSGDDTRIGDSWLGCVSYSDSPYFEIGTPGEFYWVISPNNDHSFEQCKEGPPNLSHPILPFDSPSDGIYKLGMEDVLVNGSDPKKRMQFGIYNTQHSFYCEQTGQFHNSIPFLAIGAQKERGNGQAVGIIGTENKGGKGLLEFNARVSSYVPFDCPVDQFDNCKPTTNAGAHAGIYAIASWNNIHHLLFLEFIREGVYASFVYPAKALWNWPIEDSFYYPGAKIASFATDSSLKESCGLDYSELNLSDNNFSNYKIDLTRLFRCAGNIGYFTDMPKGEIEIEGVHWFIETTGLTGELGLEIQDISLSDDDLIFRDSF